MERKLRCGTGCFFKTEVALGEAFDKTLYAFADRFVAVRGRMDDPEMSVFQRNFLNVLIHESGCVFNLSVLAFGKPFQRYFAFHGVTSRFSWK